MLFFDPVVVRCLRGYCGLRPSRADVHRRRQPAPGRHRTVALGSLAKEPEAAEVLFEEAHEQRYEQLRRALSEGALLGAGTREEARAALHDRLVVRDDLRHREAGVRQRLKGVEGDVRQPAGRAVAERQPRRRG